MNEDMKIMQILSDMEEMLNQANGFPLSKKVGVDRDEMLDLIEELRGALPYELDTALKIIKEQDLPFVQSYHSWLPRGGYKRIPS